MADMKKWEVGHKLKPEEADSLREEGIDFASLPPFLTEDRH